MGIVRAGHPSSLRASCTHVKPDAESWSGLAWIPVCATIGFYGLPDEWQMQPGVQFAPQLIAYILLAVWVSRNRYPLKKLGLTAGNIPSGLRWGLLTGLTLGLVNLSVIVYLMPWLGLDIQFLRQTPHAQVPFGIMVPWFIIVIAVLVELNFRGFLLGRLVEWWTPATGINRPGRPGLHLAVALPVGLSALTFAFDPFLVATFRHLHWIALWDGVVWGIMWIRMRNLYAVMTAHALEVVVVYLALRSLLS